MKKIIILFFICPLILQVKGSNLFEASKHSDIYNSVMQELDLFYVDSINNEKLTEKAINAALATLDPYTTYIPEKQSDDLKRITAGEYGGIGSVIMQHGNHVVISDPYEGFPAQKADLRCGDIIVAIDGKNIEGENTTYVSEQLKGTPGTSFSIEIKREGERKNIKKVVTREIIKFHPISYHTTFSDTIGYILLSEFTNKAYDEFKVVLTNLIEKHGIKALVIDLRENGGGLIDEAVKIASLFVEKGTKIVSTKGRDEQKEFWYRTNKEPIALNMPLAILVNRATASSAEILSGAFQDLDRAILLGERTFGKGLVQSIRPVKYKGYLKLTTAKYYTPSGRCVQAINYAQHDKNESLTPIPDSLTDVFYTRLGRIVRDGGGILPDTIFHQKKQPINLAFYLYTQNIIFDYATLFTKRNKQIESPEKFTISDKEYAIFQKYVKEHNPQYNLQSEKILQELKEAIDFEGYDEHVLQELESLRKKLKPNLDNDLEFCKKEIIDLLNYEIIKRFYFQKGTIRYGLRDDKWLEKAIETLQ